MIKRTGTAGLTAALCGLSLVPLLADQAVSIPAAGPNPGAAAPPPLPVPPATVSRGTEGGVTVRAVRISEPLKVDGRLDERVYTTVLPISDFIQQDPWEGETATEKTEVWILFDDRNIYVSARCWDSQPEREVVNEMRRDSTNIIQNEHFLVLLDTFHDRRSGVVFTTDPLGALRDNAVTDDGANTNADWNTVWDVKTARSENGWTVEFAIPFKSLRYNPGSNQVWGINFRRYVKWKNEASYLSPVPAFLGLGGFSAVSFAGTMVGLEVPTSGRNLEIKPYAISGLRTDRTARPSFFNRHDSDVGFDVKYGLTKGLTFDGTYNTDFAQVEDDQQQVNLTRFNLFFPERREFFLEGQGIFGFGGVNATPTAGSNTPVLFFSRRIGLSNGRAVPILGGGRVTGKIGRYSIGALNIQSREDATADARPTNFSVLRLKRDVLRRSSVGALYTRRTETQGGTGAGETLAVDALYSTSRSLNFNTYLARTRTPGVWGNDTSHLVSFDYDVDRYGLQLERLAVGRNFNPEVGFLRRTDFQREFALGRFSPRPARTHMKGVRRFIYQGSTEYIGDGAGELVQLRESVGSFAIELLNSDKLTVSYVRDYEFIPRPFTIATGVIVPVGGYDYQTGQVSYLFGAQHRPSGTLSFREGSLYGGARKTLELSGGRLDFPPHFAVEPSLSANWVSLPWGDFTSIVATARTIYTMTPRMFTSALIQYNSSIQTFSTNARFRWEYRPGSELFVVYSDGRDTLPKGFPELINRAFVVKINRLFRF